MLELFGSGLISVWLDMAGVQVKPMEAMEAMTWRSGPGLVLAPDPQKTGATTIKEYLLRLQALKLVNNSQLQSQGIWIQSGPVLMANHQGTTPLSAASLTKIATSLVALDKWGAKHQFETLVTATGPIKNQVLEGDLVIDAGGDPLFVWEEAIAIGNLLNKIGIKRVNGNLVIVGNFAMNFQRNPQLAGIALKQALNSTNWSRNISFEYSRMPKGTPKPVVAIAGNVEVKPLVDRTQTLLIRHRSLPVAQLINEMNVFSNNDMAQMLAEMAGGASAVAAKAAELARVPASEIKLINGSGLGQENQISPRAATAMLMAIQSLATPHGLSVADLFPTSGLDNRGTTYARSIPHATAFKTGTLRDVSALAGVMPTRDRGLVWFAIINRGVYVPGFRNQQDKLLQTLSKHLQAPKDIPNAITPLSTPKQIPQLGAASRNQVVYPGGSEVRSPRVRSQELGVTPEPL